MWDTIPHCLISTNFVSLGSVPVDKWRAALLARWNGRNDENFWFGIARECTQEFP